MLRTLLRAAGCTVAAALALAPAASAAPDCMPRLPAVVPLYSGGGVLESVIVDKHGHFFFSDSTKGNLLRIDRPGAVARVVATGLANTGGLAFDSNQRYLFAGVGNGFEGGLLGNVTPAAKIMRVDTRTGKYTTF